MIGASLNNQQYSFEADVVTSDVKLTFASDVATLERGNKRAVASIVSNGDGTVDLVFNHGFTTFLGASFTFVGAAADLTFQVISVSLSTKTIVIAALTAGADPAPVPDGDLYINFRFGMSAVNMG